MAPKVPWDPNDQAAGAGSSSASTTLWDLSGLNTDSQITVQYPSGMSTKHLDAGDSDLAQRSATPLSLGDPADLVKRPIQLYGTDPKGYLAFQQALYAGGFYGSTSPNSIPWGSDPTGATYDAWKRVLAAAQQAQAAGLNVTPTQVLEQGVKEHTAAAAGAGKAPLVVQTTDPAVLRGLVQQAAQQALGRNLSKGEVETFVKSFHEQEAAYSKKAYSANQDQTGKRYDLTQPNASAQATEFVDGSHPTEAGGNQLADYVGVLHQLLGG